MKCSNCGETKKIDSWINEEGYWFHWCKKCFWGWRGKKGAKQKDLTT